MTLKIVKQVSRRTHARTHMCSDLLIPPYEVGLLIYRFQHWHPRLHSVQDRSHWIHRYADTIKRGEKMWWWVSLSKCFKVIFQTHAKHLHHFPLSLFLHYLEPPTKHPLEPPYLFRDTHCKTLVPSEPPRQIHSKPLERSKKSPRGVNRHFKTFRIWFYPDV